MSRTLAPNWNEISSTNAGNAKSFWSPKARQQPFATQFLSVIRFPSEMFYWRNSIFHFSPGDEKSQRWFEFSLLLLLPTGDSIFTAGKPAILANNTLIRGSKALNNRRPITSSSSTISSQSTNNETGKERKDKALKDSMQQRYLMDSGNWNWLGFGSADRKRVCEFVCFSFHQLH